MWRIFQVAVALAVGFALIYWRENDPNVREPLSNGYLLGGIAIGAAFVATFILSKLLDLRHWLKRRQAEQRLHKRIPPHRT